ncbi:uncharacterized protein LOC108095751 isoform X2 [Drosophila ficusphila]|uniref:uncharacterized protein LOC108095751 isoform X2 n=1 Tax=Drosophila ficusphila TaxID=30025 RepID=UPI001C8AA529|nr:uncharacterized protein LOC108095751 isoform X2 [Drosophila ficusphila]
MALRLTTAFLRKRASLLFVPKLQQAQPTRTLLLRRNLVPFLDDDPCVFSKKAILHHWGVIPVIVISVVGLILKIGVMIRLAFVKDDVWFTKDSAYFEFMETRRGPWYRIESRKFAGRPYYDMPEELLLAKQGDVSGPSFDEKKKK